MENSKLSQLLSKLTELNSSSNNEDFYVIDDKCEHLKGIHGGYNPACTNGTCTDNNGACTNTTCSGSNRICKDPIK